MSLKLKENPVEWLKFTASFGAMIGMLWCLAGWRGWHAYPWWLGCLPCILATPLCWLQPHLFRPFYRGGMTCFHALGRVVSTLFLTLFFILILTPMGVWLRLTGKDLLEMHPSSQVETNWKTPRKSGGHGKMF